MSTPEQGRKTLVCQQCGRIGTRGFNILPVVYKGVDYGPLVVCAAKKACESRWPKTGGLSEYE